MMKSERRIPIPVIAATVLLCLVLVSIHMTSGMFARYMSRADGNGASHIASFDVSAEADDDSVSIVSDGTDDDGVASYTVKVKNSSETAVRYDAVLKIKPEDQSKFDLSDDNLKFSGTLAPNGEDEKQVTFDMSEYFKTNDKYNTFSNDDISGNKGECPFEVAVTFTQID